MLSRNFLSKTMTEKKLLIDNLYKTIYDTVRIKYPSSKDIFEIGLTCVTQLNWSSTSSV